MPADLDLRAEDLLPHKGPICLLDRVIAAGDDVLVATAAFGPESPFCRDGRVGSWIGLECMAQAVGAWSGYQRLLRGVPPRIGFLLGTRRFDCHRPWLALGHVLRIEVRKVIEMDDGLGQFNGQIFDADDEVASAVLTVYSPEDPTAVIRGSVSG
jgi:predicted hotdog family 3-hydroxylacyl-ACP dehydratase